MNAEKLSTLISYVIHAHEKLSKKKDGHIRRWDGKTPYAIHPIWCAMTILTETSLPEDVRIVGAEALLLHDVTEDTTAPLFECSDEVKKLVSELTFTTNDVSMELIFERSKLAQLLKLYDKVSNFLDGSWRTVEKRKLNLLHIEKLSEKVVANFGHLNITKMAQGLLQSEGNDR